MSRHVVILVLFGSAIALSDFHFSDNPYMLRWRERALAEEKRNDLMWLQYALRHSSEIGGGELPNQVMNDEEEEVMIPHRYHNPPHPLRRPPQPFYYGWPAEEQQAAGQDFAVSPFNTQFHEPAPPVYGYEVKVPEEKKEDPLPLTEETTNVKEPPPDEVYKTPIVDFNATKEDIVFIGLVAACSAAGVIGVSVLGYGIYRLQKSSKAAADVEYPAYGVTGPNKEATPTGDRRLAHSAQMYHYQLTKQQIIAMERDRSTNERRGSISEADSDDENEEEGDYTVYECPGLAPAGEMEVKNPMFQDDPTPGGSTLDPK